MYMYTVRDMEFWRSKYFNLTVARHALKPFVADTTCIHVDLRHCQDYVASYPIVKPIVLATWFILFVVQPIPFPICIIHYSNACMTICNSIQTLEVHNSLLAYTITLIHNIVTRTFILDDNL